MTPRKKALKRRLTFLASDIVSKVKKHRADRKQFKEKVAQIKSKPYRFKHLNQTITRKEKTIRQLRSTLQEQPAILQLQKVQVEHHHLKRQLASAKIRYVSKLSHHQSVFRQQLADKDAEIRSLHNDLMLLEEEVEQLKRNEQTTRDGKAYSTDIRALIYDMLVCHVPTCNVPPLLGKIAEHTGQRFTDIPHRTTVEQMARELGVISDLQTAETAMTTDNLTLGFDATTQEGVHINAVHFTTETVCRVVAIDELAGGTSDDYEGHITQSVDNLSKVYSDFHKLPYAEVRNNIIGNISNTMSDRAAVNHATITKVNAAWQKTLNELNCHLQ